MGQLKIKQRNTDEIIKPGSHVFPLLRRRRRAVEAMSLLSFTAPSTPYSLPCNTFQNYSKKVVSFSAPNAQLSVCCSCHNPQGNGEQTKSSLHSIGRRILFVYLAGTCMSPVLPSSGKTKTQNPYDEKRLLEQNKRIQRENNAPDEFPSFVREGFSVKVVTSDNYVTRDSGLVLWDVVVGEGAYPKEGQQITFHYVGYNESGRRIDSTYLQGSPAKVRLGTNALVPGFEEGIKDMKPGGKRRIIVPPELGPPVGPSTFFSAKQFEVFDVELLSIQDCTRRTIVGFYSDVVCN